MARLFHFRKEKKTRKSLLIQTEVAVPLELIVAIGKRHIVGIAELGRESVSIEKLVPPFIKPPEPEEIARELLRKLGIPESEWEEILRTRREIAI